MTGPSELRRILARLRQPPAVTVVVDANGQEWLHFGSPEIAPGVVFMIPDNGRGDGPADRQK